MTAGSDYFERVVAGQYRTETKYFHYYSWDDIGLGELYAGLFAGEVIYNKVLGWLVNEDGKCWRPDSQDLALRYAKHLALRMKDYAKHPGPDLMADEKLWEAYKKFVIKCQSTSARKIMLENAILDSRINVRLEELNANPHRLYVNNGVYDMEERFFVEAHNPYDLNTRVLPVDYDETATCPEIDKYLARVVRPEEVAFLEEVSGYLLWPGNKLKKAVLLYGPKDSGKSKYLEINRQMLGEENVSSLTLHTICENRFARSGLLGKLANIAGDLDARTVDQTDYFMMITGGDTISAERKYGSDTLDFKPDAKLIFSANEFPSTINQTDAYLDRWLIIPFPNRIPQHEQDPNLSSKILTHEELSGWFMRSIQGLHRLMDRGFFDPPESVRMAQVKYKAELDSVRAFIDECCVFGDIEWVRRATFYKQYVQWCKDNQLKPQRNTIVFNKVKQDYGAAITEGGKDGYPVYRGVGIKPLVDFPGVGYQT